MKDKVIEYLKKHPDFFLIKKWRYGIPQYRILKYGQESKYPYINEGTYCDLVPYLKEVDIYEESGTKFQLK